MKHEVLQFTGALALLASALFTTSAAADIYTFNFTGRMTVAFDSGEVIYGGDPTHFLGYQTPIGASLTYDTETGFGDSPLSLTVDLAFFGEPVTFHDITLAQIGTSNLFDGQLLADWNTSYNMPVHVEWDAMGLLSAIGSGLMQVGDKISGDVLLRDPNGDQSYSEIVIASLGSATPYSDTLIAGTGVPLQYSAPLAATSGSLGLAEGTPFAGVRVYLDIGSGNSMYVTSISAVPEPATWTSLLAGLTLIGFSIARRKQRAGGV
jgi:hypothetical protein